ncbi:MAG: hypothetical protein A2X94_13910 [Bdellovibrionales bacterium GWB1_55_8]|nr:MAG: hypothetical protein A2X94_13910 [Bdellovibrionales bacterium GWB1_55_8]
MHPEMVIRFALALGVSTDELLGVLSKKNPEHPLPRLSLKLVKRLQKIDRLLDTKQKVLLQTIDGFLRGEGISNSLRWLFGVRKWFKFLLVSVIARRKQKSSTLRGVGLFVLQGLSPSTGD